MVLTIDLYLEIQNSSFRRDILVVTAQVLVDALAKKEIDSITKFSLMIFDECHHTHANHPFNQIMSMYLDLKLDEKFDKTALPQVMQINRIFQCVLPGGQENHIRGPTVWVRNEIQSHFQHTVCARISLAVLVTND